MGISRGTDQVPALAGRVWRYLRVRKRNKWLGPKPIAKVGEKGVSERSRKLTCMNSEWLDKGLVVGERGGHGHGVPRRTTRPQWRDNRRRDNESDEPQGLEPGTRGKEEVVGRGEWPTPKQPASLWEAAGEWTKGADEAASAKRRCSRPHAHAMMSWHCLPDIVRQKKKPMLEWQGGRRRTSST